MKAKGDMNRKETKNCLLNGYTVATKNVASEYAGNGVSILCNKYDNERRRAKKELGLFFNGLEKS